MTQWQSRLVLLTVFGFQVARAQDSCEKYVGLKNLFAVSTRVTCIDLEVGQKQIVHFGQSDSPTRVPHNYELIRDSQDQYRVRLNLQLQENTFGSKQNTELTGKVRANIEKCLDEINPHLIGPDNKKLKIELLSPAECKSSQYKEIENWISVDDEPIHRASSGNYSVHTSCTLIAHELMHLMGLVDEYKEPEHIGWTEQDCRSLGPPDSIMANPTEAIDSNEKFKQKVSLVCCTCQDLNCQAYSDSEIGQFSSCPSNYQASKRSLSLTQDGPEALHA